MRAPYLPHRGKPTHQFAGYGQPTDPEPKFYCDEFLGDALQPEWTATTVGVATAAPSAVSGGVFQLSLTATSQAQDALLDQANLRAFDLKAGLFFETRIAKISDSFNYQAVFGMAGNHNSDKDTITEAAWFRFQNDNGLLVESDDTTNNNDDVATGTTIVLGEYNVYGIDFSDLNDVRFFFNGKRKGMGTTFDMSNLTDAEALMQPYFSIDKGSGAGITTLRIDYVKIWQEVRAT